MNSATWLSRAGRDDQRRREAAERADDGERARVLQHRERRGERGDGDHQHERRQRAEHAVEAERGEQREVEHGDRAALQHLRIVGPRQAQAPAEAEQDDGGGADRRQAAFDRQVGVLARVLGEEGQADEEDADAGLDDRVAAEQPAPQRRERVAPRDGAAAATRFGPGSASSDAGACESQNGSGCAETGAGGSIADIGIDDMAAVPASGSAALEATLAAASPRPAFAGGLVVGSGEVAGAVSPVAAAADAPRCAAGRAVACSASKACFSATSWPCIRTDRTTSQPTTAPMTAPNPSPKKAPSAPPRIAPMMLATAAPTVFRWRTLAAGFCAACTDPVRIARCADRHRTAPPQCAPACVQAICVRRWKCTTVAQTPDGNAPPAGLRSDRSHRRSRSARAALGRARGRIRCNPRISRIPTISTKSSIASGRARPTPPFPNTSG